MPQSGWRRTGPGRRRLTAGTDQTAISKAQRTWRCGSRCRCPHGSRAFKLATHHRPCRNCNVAQITADSATERSLRHDQDMEAKTNGQRPTLRLLPDDGFELRRQKTLRRLTSAGVPPRNAEAWIYAWDESTVQLRDFRRAADFWDQVATCSRSRNSGGGTIRWRRPEGDNETQIDP